MTYKTILVHCNDARRAESLLRPAIALADKFQSHLVGLSVVPPVSIASAGALEAPPMILDAQCEIYREQNPRLRQTFEDMTLGKSFTSEWRDADAGADNVARIVLEQARVCDLVVASQIDAGWASSEWLDVPDRLAMESGRPVLIVANAGAFAGIGTRVLVAWNGRREAARAVFDALPILKGSEAVKIVRIAQHAGEHDVFPSQDVGVALARHGVKCGPTELIASQEGVGETLMSNAKAFRADLIVMGCYGHSRLTEFVFGGASRYFFKENEISILMSH